METRARAMRPPTHRQHEGQRIKNHVMLGSGATFPRACDPHEVLLVPLRVVNTVARSGWIAPRKLHCEQRGSANDVQTGWNSMGRHTPTIASSEQGWKPGSEHEKSGGRAEDLHPKQKFDPSGGFGVGRGKRLPLPEVSGRDILEQDLCGLVESDMDMIVVSGRRLRGKGGGAVNAVPVARQIGCETCMG